MSKYVACQGRIGRGDFVKCITVLGQAEIYRRAYQGELCQGVAVDNDNNERVPIAPLSELGMRQCLVHRSVESIPMGKEVKVLEGVGFIPEVAPCSPDERTDLFAEGHGDRSAGIIVRSLPGADWRAQPRIIPVVDQYVNAILRGHGWTEGELR